MQTDGDMGWRWVEGSTQTRKEHNLRTPTYVAKKSRHVTRAKQPKRQRRSALTDSRCQLVSMISVDSNGIWASNQSYWLSYEIIFPSICGSSKTKSVYVLGVYFTTDWSSNSIWIGPPTWLGRPCLTPKVVSKEEEILEHLLSILHLLGACSNLGLGPKCE
jgi:hypothetical protein